MSHTKPPRKGVAFGKDGVLVAQWLLLGEMSKRAQAGAVGVERNMELKHGPER
jgi:hypothetical protein